MTHLIPCTTFEIDAKETAQLLFQQVFRYHGLPISIVSDRDPRFTSDMWESLMKIINTRLKLSTPAHPQTDGQTERMNRTVRSIITKYHEEYKEEWDKWIPAVEFAINSAKQSSTGKSPFEINYGFQPFTPTNLA
ncbi:hypothetical protein DFA_04468 [Cavenderia fasciculata]|uniref:Integrase catalytic domain-containing protein n=1 Tax=Cavenderia fasciculata TaxID=261658 RepID=F4PPN7_CACFS|nr:uncharacterized protein DFA_04468 [Cavenderia fasciculata]EGG22350.1 hypothetical protein DFA_04468 [Cavenderia fasciculata]|eukprot:XP_004360201.1 hypothetical protein DFA_04468 [Cavenderia fasciculata]